MNIEYGEKSDTKLTYDNALLYCFCIGPGWRLPSLTEIVLNDKLFGIPCWNNGDVDKKYRNSALYYALPVRNIEIIKEKGCLYDLPVL